MCGIIGFSGCNDALSKVLEGLDALEYRGYDSSGVAFFEDQNIRCIKKSGRMNELRAKISQQGKVNTTCAIGHTRWATHGRPTDENSHPHGTDNVMIVHNGIIENCDEIKKFLIEKGYSFLSETDTEAAAKLMDFYYSKTADALKTIRMVTDKLCGSYAIACIFSGKQNTIYAFRKDNPLIVAPSEEGVFVSSDISAVIKYTNKYYTLGEGEVAAITSDGAVFVSCNGTHIHKETKTVHISMSDADKGGFKHFMLKEIFEQSEVTQKTLSAFVKNGKIDLGLKNPGRFNKIHITACGTAYHAGLVGKYAIEKLCRIPTDCSVASEFRYTFPIINPGELVILISQSGETADTLAALRLAKEKGAHTLAIVNAPNSQIAREADTVLQTLAGREVSVASTKAYSVQLAVLYLLALNLADAKGCIEPDELKRITQILLDDVPQKISRALNLKEKCESTALGNINAKSIFFIGRGIDYAQSCEAALKAKEISYIHCEAYPAGELKHGTISLVEKGTPVVAIITEENLADKMISNIKEVKSRGAKVIVFLTEDINIGKDISEEIIPIPKTEAIFMPLVCAPALQLMAYYMSYHLGLDVDKPRNLAKSVTVE